MPIQTACPECQKSYTLADRQAGKKVRCQGCAAVFVVPGPGADPEPADEDDDRVRTRTVAGQRTAPRRPRDDHDEDGETERSARRRKPSREDYDDEDDYEDRRRPVRKKGGVPLWVWLVGGGGVFVLLLIGGVILFVALRGPSITKENYQKIKPGMTEAEVVAILGKPTEELDPGSLFDNFNKGFGKDFAKDFNKDLGQFPKGLLGKTLIWRRGGDHIAVTLDGNGKVTARELHVGGWTEMQSGTWQ
jgi:predicted Zn finger-like uncharacterized protein